MRLSKEPLGQVMGNPRAITAKKEACAIFKTSQPTARRINERAFVPECRFRANIL